MSETIKSVDEKTEQEKISARSSFYLQPNVKTLLYSVNPLTSRRLLVEYVSGPGKLDFEVYLNGTFQTSMAFNSATANSMFTYDIPALGGVCEVYGINNTNSAGTFSVNFTLI